MQPQLHDGSGGEVHHTTISGLGLGSGGLRGKLRVMVTVVNVIVSMAHTDKFTHSKLLSV